MARSEWDFPYPRERAVEDVRHNLGLLPTRVFACLLPLWRVEVEATVTEGLPYALIDRYLEAAIASAGLYTAPELAAFYALDEILVDRALKFLVRIGHLSETGGRHTLTPLGRLSVRDGKRYEVKKGDRRVLYFDALASQPLRRAYYDSKSVTIVDAHDLGRFTEPDHGVRFQLLGPSLGLAANALADLASRPDRDRFNLPEGVNDLVAIGSARPNYLPMYVIRAEPLDGDGSKPRYLAYTQASREVDPELTDVCEQDEFLAARLEQLEAAGLAGGDRRRVEKWLNGRGLKSGTPAELVEGTWRLRLPESAFGGKGGISVAKLGQYAVSGDSVFQLWCASRRARTRALLERVASYLGAARSPDAAQVEARLAQFNEQLELDVADLKRLAAIASAAGRSHLAEQLRELS